MTARELRRWWRSCTFEAHEGGIGHLTVIRDGRPSQLPMHGSNEELGADLVNKIKKDLDFD
jgi:mRNA interferase HicA